MKKIILVLGFFILPFSVSADEVATTTVTVNVRYGDGLVWSGLVELTPSSSTNINDSSGTSRSIPSDSALKALSSADDLSPNFSISELNYYIDFNSLYLRCINISSPSVNACDNWQYVVNSTYPSVGMDKYSVSNGDVLYFYFGNPRRVTLSSVSAAATAPVTARAESYDYVNNAWTALSGAVLGATQPNPEDPYSPLVILSATSDENGFAQIILGAPGSYNIGLAMDYYYPAEPLTVSTPPVVIAEQIIATPELTSRSGGRSSSNSESNSNVISSVAPTIEKKPNEVVKIEPKTETTNETDSILVKVDIEMDSFLEKYALALENQKQNRVITVKPKFDYQIASVIVATEMRESKESKGYRETWVNKTFNKILNFFGFNK